MPVIDTPQVREARRRKLQQELEAIVPRLAAQGVQKIVLFGSLTTRDVGAFSDIDLIVVMDTQERFLDRLERLYAAAKPRMAVDMLVYNPDELQQMVQCNAWLANALEKGQVLYEA